MSIFIILRLVQCTCFALYVLWNKWSTVMVKLVVFISKQVDIETISVCLCDCGEFLYMFISQLLSILFDLFQIINKNLSFYKCFSFKQT